MEQSLVQIDASEENRELINRFSLSSVTLEDREEFCKRCKTLGMTIKTDDMVYCRCDSNYHDFRTKCEGT